MNLLFLLNFRTHPSPPPLRLVFQERADEGMDPFIHKQFFSPYHTSCLFIIRYSWVLSEIVNWNSCLHSERIASIQGYGIWPVTLSQSRHLKVPKSIHMGIAFVCALSECYYLLLARYYNPVKFVTKNLIVRKELFGRDRLLSLMAEEARMQTLMTKADLTIFSDMYLEKARLRELKQNS